MLVSTVGLDVAKNIFQIHGVDASGWVVLRKSIRRGQMTDCFANLTVCVIGIEAKGGANFWSRMLSTFGHTVRLISPKFVIDLPPMSAHLII
jgi:transposase